MPKIVRYDGNVKAFASEALATEKTTFGTAVESDSLYIMSISVSVSVSAAVSVTASEGVVRQWKAHRNV